MSKTKGYLQRKTRIHSRIRKKSGGRPRLTVFRSGRHIYAQVIDDGKGVTLAAASSVDKELSKQLKSGADKEAAAIVGRKVAERSLEAGVKSVVFDRSGYRYHGRVKELAEGARQQGLDF